jgi:transcriptional regulator with XRE-family HTH domain
MNKERLGKFIREQREAAGLTRNSFSDKAGRDANFIYDIETGRKGNASMETLFLLAEALSIDPRKVFEAAEVEFPIREKPSNFIPLPFDFPDEARQQVERFAKFLQYEKEFDRFLSLHDDAALRENLDAYVRELQALFPTDNSNGHAGSREDRVS